MFWLHGKDDLRKKEWPLSVLSVSPNDRREPLSMLSLHHRVSHIEEQKLLSWDGTGFAIKRSTCVRAQYRVEG